MIEELKVSRNTALPEFQKLAQAGDYKFDKVTYEKFWKQSDPPLDKPDVISTTNIMETVFSK